MKRELGAHPPPSKTSQPIGEGAQRGERLSSVTCKHTTEQGGQPTAEQKGRCHLCSYRGLECRPPPGAHRLGEGGVGGELSAFPSKGCCGRSFWLLCRKWAQTSQIFTLKAWNPRSYVKWIFKKHIAHQTHFAR